MFRILRFLFFIIFSLYVAMFAAINRQDVTIELLPGLYTMIIPVTVLVFTSAIFGFLLASGYHSSAKHAFRKKVSQQEKQIKKLQEEKKTLQETRSTSLMVK